MKHTRGVLAVTAVILLSSVNGFAVDHYVSVTGSPSGRGTIDSPWDLQTALSKPATVQPGDTIWLRGGTYLGPFTSTLAGTASAPITVRSYKGEWAKIDGSKSTRLAAAITSIANPVSCTLQDGSAFPDGSNIQIDNEQLHLTNKSGNTYRCWRSLNGTGAATHAAGATALKLGNVLDSNGSYVWWRDFEITSTRPLRQINNEYRGAGLNMSDSAKGNKAINLIIHDVGHPAIGFWNQSDGGEIYGCIIWGAGIYQPGFGAGDLLGSRRGSAIYASNQTGRVLISDTIAFRNLTNGFHISTTNGATNGFTLEGNIVFDNSTGELFANGGDSTLQTGLRVLNNYTFVRSTALTNAARMGYGKQGDMEFRSNYVVGGENRGLLVADWSTRLIVTDNMIVSSGPLANFTRGGAATTWDRNTYYTPYTRYQFSLDDRTSLYYPQWKSSTGLDVNSTYFATRPPNRIFVRENKYQPGRGHIAVYNWENRSSVQVDVSEVLQSGVSYEIRDAQNYFGAPVASGTYSGQLITIPMNLSTVAPLVGSLSTISNTHTAPSFGAFVIVTKTGGTTSPAQMTVTAGPTQTVRVGQSASFSGSVANAPSGTTVRWSKKSGPGTVTFSNATANTTSATFSVVGSYVITFTATGGGQTASDDVSVNVVTSTSSTGAPVISGIQVGSITTSDATIRWTTDQPASSNADYGTTTSYGRTATSATYKTTHSITLSGLSANTTYYYRIRSANSSGQVGTSSGGTFKTATTSTSGGTAPTISGLAVTSVTTNGARIAWLTNVPATSQIEYWSSTSGSRLTPLSTALTTTHAITLSGLTRNTTYYFRLRSASSAGSLAVSTTYATRTLP